MKSDAQFLRHILDEIKFTVSDILNEMKPKNEKAS